MTKTAGDQAVSVILAGAVTLIGTILPVSATAGVRVVARDQGTGLVATDTSAMVDQSGAFSLRLAPNRSYRLVAEPLPRGAFARTVLGTSIAVDGTPVQTLAPVNLSSGRPYLMTVTGGDVALQGALVQVFCPASSTRCLDATLPLAEALTDANGRFTVTLPIPSP
jgi:hypothetical protein